MLLAGMVGLWIAGCINVMLFLIVFQRSNILVGVVPFLSVAFVLGLRAYPSRLHFADNS